jgi:hypothetical protein
MQPRLLIEHLPRKAQTAGIHPKTAQERLGHSTITTTLDLYSHATDTMQDEAAARLDSAFRSAIKDRLKQGPARIIEFVEQFREQKIDFSFRAVHLTI